MTVKMAIVENDGEPVAADLEMVKNIYFEQVTKKYREAKDVASRRALGRIDLKFLDLVVHGAAADSEQIGGVLDHP